MKIILIILFVILIIMGLLVNFSNLFEEPYDGLKIKYKHLPDEARESVVKIINKNITEFMNQHTYRNSVESPVHKGQMFLPFKNNTNYYGNYYVRDPKVNYDDDADGKGKRRLIVGMEDEIYYTEYHFMNIFRVRFSVFDKIRFGMVKFFKGKDI